MSKVKIMLKQISSTAPQRYHQLPQQFYAERFTQPGWDCGFMYEGRRYFLTASEATFKDIE